MEIEIIPGNSNHIRELREVFLAENAIEFIYNKCHENNWAQAWLFKMDETSIGYAATWGLDPKAEKKALFEFYLTAPYRHLLNRVFEKFLPLSPAEVIECQSNDPLLAALLFEYAQNIRGEALLFEDDGPTQLSVPGAEFTQLSPPAQGSADQGNYALKLAGEVVATGGFMLNYNKPYADIYMEVKEGFRNRGLGSLLIQELKNEICRMGRVPAARCNISNRASKAALMKAGFKVCGVMLKGDIVFRQP
ncbi:MAG: GNAT family N-acetyltransferase [Bacteroidota bacterium]